MKISFLLLITIFSIFFFPKIINAQISFSILPEKFNLELSPGQIHHGAIRISNQNQRAMSFNVQVKNFSANGEKGEIIFTEGGDLSFNPSQWIEFKERNFMLEAKQMKTLDFVINVPESAEVGGHYATAIFQTEVSNTEAENSTKIFPSLGAIFLLKIKGGEEKYPALDKQMDLVEFIKPAFVEGGVVNFSFRLKNNDPSHIKVGGYLNVYNIFNKLKEKIIIEDQTILPQKIRLFEAKTKNKKFFEKIIFGPYRAELVLSTTTWREKIGNHQQLIKKFNFFALPWKIF